MVSEAIHDERDQVRRFYKKIFHLFFMGSGAEKAQSMKRQHIAESLRAKGK